MAPMKTIGRTNPEARRHPLAAGLALPGAIPLPSPGHQPGAGWRLDVAADSIRSGGLLAERPGPLRPVSPPIAPEAESRLSREVRGNHTGIGPECPERNSGMDGAKAVASGEQ
jgi:hypothetical protein